MNGFLGFGSVLVLNICFTNLWVLWEFGLYLYLGNSHVYYPGILGLFFINKSGNWYLVQGCGSKVPKNLSSSLFGYKRGCISHILG